LISHTGFFVFNFHFRFSALLNSGFTYYSLPTIPKIRNPQSEDPQSEGSGQRQRQQDGGIDVNPLPPNSDVQVWRSGSAGSAAQPNDLTLLHGVAFAHFNFGQVHIKRQ
jgi:hypothetical protein